MNISLNWLREWANPDVSDAALAETLTFAGLEVNSINKMAPNLRKIVVAEVVQCEKHPNADKLNLCQVSIGQSENLQIICGAANVRKGLKVVVATVGAVIADGSKIKQVKLRSSTSMGMICSESELGLSDVANSIMVLEDSAIIGQDIRKHLDLDDTIIDLDITPNRGDCFSVMGVAREVCANYNLPLAMPNYQVDANINDKVSANIDNKTACPRYLTRVIKGIDNTVTTPRWIAQKLQRAGQQTHSPVVDISNFVLLELGQPTHAFDLAKINGEIYVRMAKTGEKIELLNEQTHSLNANTLVIADSQKVLAIAGVMGGIQSATQTHSQDILLESAFFEPVSMAGKARQYTLHTESSLRFERGVDFNISRLAMQRVTQLILDICGGQCGVINEYIDTPSLPKLPTITISKTHIQKILGFELDSAWIVEKFNHLGFEISSQSTDSWCIIPPSFRFDISIPTDVIEELARLYGYDKIPVQKLTTNIQMNTHSEALIDLYQIALRLVNRGYQEVITYSFISSEYHHLLTPKMAKIALNNPLSNAMSIMRSSLWAGLLQSMMANQKHGHNSIRFFETGLCFEGTEAHQQIQKIGGIISGNRFAPQWAASTEAVDFFDMKSDVESLLRPTKLNYDFVAAENPALQKGQTARINCAGKPIGWIGALSSKVQQKLSTPKCYLFELDLAFTQQGNIPKYQAFSNYQRTNRDIALMIDATISVDEIIDSIKQMKQKDFLTVNLFDVYSGNTIPKGKKSIALSLGYQSSTQTLTDQQLRQKVDKVLALLQQKYKAEQR